MRRACGGAPLNHRGPRAERARVVEINKRQINESAETNGGALCTDERIRGRLIYFAARKRKREREREQYKWREERREREREREKGFLEAEHGPAVIKEMNGYRGADFFTPLSSFFFPSFFLLLVVGRTTRSATSVRPSVPFRFAHLRGLHTGCPSIAGRDCMRSHRRHAYREKDTQTRIIRLGYNNYSPSARDQLFKDIRGNIQDAKRPRMLFISRDRASDYRIEGNKDKWRKMNNRGLTNSCTIERIRC